MSYYPVFLDLRDRSCLIVGGGEVALGKIRNLLGAGARVKVVAPYVNEGLQALSEQGTVDVVARPYDSADVRGFHLVIAATDELEVNQRVSADAEKAGVLVNVVDCPELSSFIAPAVLERGELQVAVSTSGASPAFAAYLRDELRAEIGPEYEVLLRLLRRVREQLRSESRSMSERKLVVRGLCSAGLVDCVRRGDRGRVDALLREHAGPGSSLDALGVEIG